MNPLDHPILASLTTLHRDMALQAGAVSAAMATFVAVLGWVAAANVQFVAR